VDGRTLLVQRLHVDLRRQASATFRRLRDKVGDGIPLIATVRGVGYRIDPAASLVIEDW
jgi:DNA-binding response OmpR family regulator